MEYPEGENCSDEILGTNVSCEVLNVLLQQKLMVIAVSGVILKAYLSFVLQTDLFRVYFCRG